MKSVKPETSSAQLTKGFTLSERLVVIAILPRLGDSSGSRGLPHIRMSSVNQGSRSFAVRYNKIGPIFTLDGSTKMIGGDRMENFGLKTGYIFKPFRPATDPVELAAAF